MWGGSAFAHVLDQKLRDCAGAEPEPHAVSPSHVRHVLAPHPLLFVAPLRPFRRICDASLGDHARASTHDCTAYGPSHTRDRGEPARPRRTARAVDDADSRHGEDSGVFGWSRSATRPAATPHRRLTPQEQHAFDALNRLGAGLPADFTAAQLRSAFRALARRYHPDKHPLALSGQKARLAEVFTAIVAHQARLMTLLNQPDGVR
jgi:hypothetical protein